MSVLVNKENAKSVAISLHMGLYAWGKFEEDKGDGFILMPVPVHPDLEALSTEDVQKIANDETAKLSNRDAVKAILEAHLSLIA